MQVAMRAQDNPVEYPNLSKTLTKSAHVVFAADDEFWKWWSAYNSRNIVRPRWRQPPPTWANDV
jgi:hypothetical protein